MQRVHRRRAADDRGAVLIVVEDGDAHRLLAGVLDDETIRRLDVLKVHRTEGRLQRLDDLGQLVGVRLVHLDIVAVDIGEFLEERGLALHHRLRRQRADIAEPQNRRAVGNDGDQIALAGEPRRAGRVFLDGRASVGDARRIGEAQVAARRHRLGDADLQLTGTPLFVIAKRVLAKLCARVVEIVGHGNLPRRLNAVRLS